MLGLTPASLAVRLAHAPSPHPTPHNHTHLEAAEVHLSALLPGEDTVQRKTRWAASYRNVYTRARRNTRVACRQGMALQALRRYVHHETHRCGPPKLIGGHGQSSSACQGLATGCPFSLPATHHMCASQRLVLRCLVTPLNLLLWPRQAAQERARRESTGSTRTHKHEGTQQERCQQHSPSVIQAAGP